MTTKRELIEAKAIELLKSNPQGMRTSQLINAIKENLQDIQDKLKASSPEYRETLIFDYSEKDYSLFINIIFKIN